MNCNCEACRKFRIEDRVFTGIVVFVLVSCVSALAIAAMLAINIINGSQQ